MPGPAFNWFCVAHSVLEIVSHAAEIKASQLAARTTVTSASHQPRKRRRIEEPVPEDAIIRAMPFTWEISERDSTESPVAEGSTRRSSAPLHELSLSPLPSLDIFPNAPKSPPVYGTPDSTSVPSATRTTKAQTNSWAPALYVQDSTSLPIAAKSFQGTPIEHSVQGPKTSSKTSTITDIPSGYELYSLEPVHSKKLQSSKVPSSRIGRLFHYGGLAASLSYGAASELLRRTTSPDDHASSSLMMTEGNIKRLVSKLTQMRGAALKLGQFMSIQDSHVLPPEIEDIFRRVQDSAHYMPDWQMEAVMRSSLGPDWQSHFISFDRVPFAAASIGQVHSAVLAATSSPTGKDEAVAVKIQFPNIVNSIESDLGYVKLLLTAGRLLPKGLFLDRTIEVMKSELADECNYTREASFLRRFGQHDHLGSNSKYKVPWVWDGSTDHVLVMERVGGVSVGGSTIDTLSQQDRDDIASRIIDLCLKELFVFRVMQTDPNWTNFLWNPRTRQVELVDFGATREYTKEFIDNWLHLLQAAASEEREACIEWSLKLGYLTGEETGAMLDAHVKSMTLLATPFKATTPQPFAFGPGSTWNSITAEIRDQIPVMLKYRLTPPPRETYSLNRKLSGAFLLAARLGAKVDCRQLWEIVVSKYQFGPESSS